MRVLSVLPPRDGCVGESSRLRMSSFPEGGNGDIMSDDRRNWDLARETNPLRV